MQGLTATVVIGLATAVYVLPGCIAIIAARRGQWAIVGLNLLTGWTILGWVGALMLACKYGVAGRGTADATSPYANDNVGERAAREADPTPAKIPVAPPRFDPYADWLDDQGALSAGGDNALPGKHDESQKQRRVDAAA